MRSAVASLVLLVGGVLALAPARGDEVSSEPTRVPATRQLSEPVRYGSYYDRWEPTFYTGFAPRADEPARVHLHVGRGNQLRITVVLSEPTLANYARDLKARRDTYRKLVDSGRIRRTQNDALDEFEAALDAVGIDVLVARAAALSPALLRQQNLTLMEALNPGRVFRIEVSETELVRRWLSELRPGDRGAVDRDRRLELLNALLPTRLWIAETDAGMRAALQALVAAAPAAGAAPSADFVARYFALLERLRPGLYPRRDGELAFVEFTAIQPIGTFNDYTDYRGRKIPLYPTPGRRALTTHQRTHTVDHIPTVAAYSYSPWIPYMHVGSNMHNSFHTLWWRMAVDETPFLPEPWRRAGDGKRYLWLLSRGPMSSGCTHLTTGHIGELRQLLPSDTEALYAIDTFYNRSYDLDVFDIDGDLEPEVMGVQYYIAYSLSQKRPKRLRVKDERLAYYEWLYAGDFELDGEGRAWLVDVQDGRFVERTAKRGRQYARLPLYEAAYEPERFQFYELVDIPFARELRKLGVDHPLVLGSE
ncbi:MAG: hypothetical protein JRH16_08775 [Deltaproteobacteria bacterium]|nr:hypothetical protein [Deltaproteobacteria bacterium]MBW2362749.1 hypothetical protein [Deltaproteobacteria bacterium]